MKAFKKRTIALVLASVVTVVGAFGAENYKNSLMGLSFEQRDEGVNLVLQTRTAYEAEITPMRRDQNTYVVMLPEMNSRAVSPNLNKVAGNISSVDIQTIPYSNNSKGYTRITIKTTPSTILGVEKQIFIPGENYRYLEHSSSEEDRRDAMEQERIRIEQMERLRNEAEARRVAEHEQAEQEAIKEKQKKEAQAAELARQKQEALEKAKKQAETIQKAQEENVISEPETITNNESISDETVVSDDYYENNNLYTYILAGILLMGLIVFFIVKAKNKLHELTGESINIDVSEEEDKAKKAKKEAQAKQKETKKSKPIVKKNIKPEIITPQVSIEPEAGPIETVNVVDLDEIFKEQGKVQETSSIEDDENAALEDFLSGFSFDEDMLLAAAAEEEEEEETPGYDVEFYDKVINAVNCKFSKDDVDKINKLLNMEINDSTLKNIEKYAVSNPIKKQPNKKQILEDFVTTYAISQNVVFTKDDIGALYKLISVEIDSDFITNLKTNPERVKEVEAELKSNTERPRKVSEILTLNVKDVLPDLSEALRKQGGRAIQSEVKPQTIYFSEGYEVSKLTVGNALPDLSTEINNKDAYVSKPSAKYDLVDNSYDVSRLKISNQLPDLVDMLKNPDKYKKEEVVVEVDEDALLNNITNVQFKPFDAGQEFEILNDLEPQEETTVIDIQKELSQFDNLEIVEPDNDQVFEELNVQEVDNLYQNDYIDLDNKENNQDFSFVEDQPTIEETTVENDVEILEELLEENVVVETSKEEKGEILNPTQKEELSNPQETQKPIENTIKEEQPVILQRNRITPENRVQKAESKELSQDLLKRIEEVKSRRVERNERINSLPRQIQSPAQDKTSSKVIADIKCIFEGETYTVISTAHFIGRAGCYLAKNEKGYIILGHYGEKLINLKQYETLKSEKIQTRLSEKLSDDTYRYLVRIGINKFVVDVNGDNINYVMDLC